MYLEFKDSFEYNDTSFDRGWYRETNAVDELNEWINQHKDYQVTVIQYQVSYSKRHDFNQTHIFAEAVHIEEPSKEEIPQKPEKPRALKLGWSI